MIVGGLLNRLVVCDYDYPMTIRKRNCDMGANREAWKGDLVRTLGRQVKLAERKDGDCFTVVWVEQFCGRSAITDCFVALELHDDCTKLRALDEGSNPPCCPPSSLEWARRTAQNYLEGMKEGAIYIDPFRIQEEAAAAIWRRLRGRPQGA